MEQLNQSFNSYYTRLKTMATEGKSGFFETSGFQSMDDIIMGYFYGEMVLVAGRPGMGVSTFLMETAINVARKNQSKVGYVKLGERSNIFQSKLVGMLAGINYEDMLRLKLRPEDFAKIDANEELKTLPLYLNFPKTHHYEDIIPDIQQQIEEHGLKYVIIDDIQSMNSKDRKSFRSRYDELNEIVRELKNLAERNDIILIASSRMSRKVEETSDKRPLLSHLRETGMLEDSADKVLLLYRPSYYKIMQDADGNSTDSLIEVIVAKNNSGSSADIHMGFYIDNGNVRIKELNVLWEENWQDQINKWINEDKPKNNDDIPF